MLVRASRGHRRGCDVKQSGAAFGALNLRCRQRFGDSHPVASVRSGLRCGVKAVLVAVLTDHGAGDSAGCGELASVGLDCGVGRSGVPQDLRAVPPSHSAVIVVEVSNGVGKTRAAK